ncbi:hypothetical protein [Lactiplantibacillus plajomi]|uniref:Uncharacterized protein n=1 Tax=Lactiplantibacillus plajomi TaxID=1457217 RepID=A0ABV6K197_9LACO|nr:hypothetical protein [Lactiplantibacillus plajomi]
MEEKWLTFREASQLIGKNSHYLSTLFRVHPEYFEGVEVKKIGTTRTKIINKDQLEKVELQVKKIGALRKSEVFLRVKHKKNSLVQRLLTFYMKVDNI